MSAAAPPRPWRLLSVLLVTGLSTSSCGTDAPPSAARPAASAGAGAGAGAGAANLAALNFDDRKATLHDAEQELLRRCLSSAGFDFKPTSAATVRALREAAGATATDGSYQFSLTDVESARAQGYGRGDRSEDEGERDRAGDGAADASRAVDPNAAYVQTLSPARRAQYTDAMEGPKGYDTSIQLSNGLVLTIASQGCVADARRRLYGDLESYMTLNTVTLNLPGEVLGRLESDPRYRDAVSAWSDCMSGDGFDISDPATARARAADLPLEQARRLAVDEATCAQETGAATRVDAIQAELANQVAASHEGEITGFSRLLDDSVGRAADVLGGE